MASKPLKAFINREACCNFIPMSVFKKAAVLLDHRSESLPWAYCWLRTTNRVLGGFYPDGLLRHNRSVSSQISAHGYLREMGRKEGFRFVLSQKDLIIPKQLQAAPVVQKQEPQLSKYWK